MRVRAVSFSLSLLILTALHIALAPADQAAAQAPDPLTLTITAERAECTAGTLNPVTWEIRGGTPPYTLTVDGTSVDADAESAPVTCGALPEGATEAPGTITASVTDTAGAPATARAAYTIVPPLPAPTELRHVSYPGFVYARWSDVPGVGKVTLEDDDGRPYTLDAYLVRYREVGATEWIHVLRTRTVRDVWEVFDSGIREFSVASLRHPLERRTPDALRWSAAHRYAPVQAPQNVVATATHDTVTVSWDGQPLGAVGKVRLHTGTGDITKSFPLATSTGRESVTFGRLPPSTTFQVHVEYETAGSPDGFTSTEVVTLPPPPDYEPPPAGPKDIRVSATHNTITVSWRASREDSAYVVDVYPAGTSARAHIADLPPGTTTVTADGNALPIQPDTLYEVLILEHGIPSVTERVMIRTALSPAQSAPPLTMILTAERSECTAGTLNPVTWTITGGTAPYTLTVAGETVDADAESAAVTCGALPDYGIWLPVTQAPGTITAVVMDAAGWTTTASAAYTVVPPLPAPRLRPGPATVEETLIIMSWRPVPGARPAGRVGHYLLRWRPADASTWRYVAVEDNEPLKPWIGGIIWELEGGATYQHQSAAMRDPIEQETPQQLAWSATQTTTTAHPPTGVVATATHNTLTVRWNPQAASLVWITLNPRQAGMRPIDHSWRLGDQPADQVTFVALKPATTYTITVSVQGDFPERLSTSIQARTTSAPPGWTPPRRGPQNVRASATHDSITVRWEHPHTGAPPIYQVFVAHPTAPGRHVELVRGRTEFTLGLLEPETTYTVEIRHLGLIKAPVTVEVRTNAPPATGPSASPTLTCFEYLVGAVVCTWETSLARPPV